MAHSPYFTVVVTTFARPELLEECVASVVGQTFSDWELIVVDDASPMAAVIPDDERIQLIRNDQNLGKPASVNRALQVARGRYVAFLDDDDVWTNSRLQHARAVHWQGSDVVYCGHGVLPTGGISSRTAGDEVVVRPRFHHMGATSVNRFKCPDFDEAFRAVEDLEWAVRLEQQDVRIGTVQSLDFYWRRHSGKRHGNGTRQRVQGNLRLLHKHQGYFDSHPREKAKRLHRIGLFEYLLGSRRLGLRYAARSFATHPTVDAAELAVRVFLPRSVSWTSLKNLSGRG